jgi:ribose transport system permease protein
MFSKLSVSTPRLVTLAVLIALISAIFQILAPTYLSHSNIHAILRHMASGGVVGVGLTFVIAVRRFDLSLAGVATLGALTLGFLIAKTNSLSVAVLGCVAIGAAGGLINGLLIGLAKLPDVVATIAVGSIAYGVSYFYNGGQSYSDNFFTSGILDINDSSVLGIDMPIVIFLLTGVVATVALQMTRYGDSFYATGENPIAARLSGVPIEKMIAFAFVIWCPGLRGDNPSSSFGRPGYGDGGKQRSTPGLHLRLSGSRALRRGVRPCYLCRRSDNGAVAQRIYAAGNPLLLQRHDGERRSDFLGRDF